MRERWLRWLDVSGTSGRYRVSVGLAILALLAASNIAAIDRGVGQPNQSGLTILGPEPRPNTAASPPSVVLAREWSNALTVAENNPDDHGYPWPDETTGQLVVSIVNSRGQESVRQWQQAGVVVTRGAKSVNVRQPTVPIRVRLVKFSYAQLEAIKDEAIMLDRAGVPDASSIWRTGPDYENNRVLITVDRASGALFATLAQRYGREAIAVRIDPNRRTPQLATGTRAADFPQFHGGARINTPRGQQVCTSGWPWVSGSQYYLMTAGHCIPDGGSVSTPGGFVGTVTAYTRENWAIGLGTVAFPGEGVYRGDLALSTATSALGRIYSQGLDSTVVRLVAEMWFGAPTPGDQFCTGGSYSFEVCGWWVPNPNDVRNNWNTNEGTLLRATRGYKPNGQCILGGDSGGPVYTIRWDSQVAAKGIISSMFQGPPWDPFCEVYFTDMDLAYWYFPGVLAVYPP